jgi:hypothetical protein
MALCVGTMLNTASADLISPNTIVSNWGRYDGVVGGNTTTWSANGSILASKNNNSSGTIASDFTTSTSYSFSGFFWGVGDNDLFGVVFGFQDADNTYALTWGGGGVHDWNGLGLVKVVNGSASVLTTITGAPAKNPIQWTKSEGYAFKITQNGNQIEAHVYNDNGDCLEVSVIDDTYLTGKIGMTVYSQKAEYAGIDYTPAQVPVPGAVLLGCMGLGISGYKLRRKKA